MAVCGQNRRILSSCDEDVAKLGKGECYKPTKMAQKCKPKRVSNCSKCLEYSRPFLGIPWAWDVGKNSRAFHTCKYEKGVKDSRIWGGFLEKPCT